ncbi:hypothetical protein MTO96_030315, partial [Rhipicephalus appendiculatus]
EAPGRKGWQSLKHRLQVRRVRTDDDNDMVVYLQNRGEEQSSSAAAGGGDEEEDEGQVQTIRLVREQPARRSVRVNDAARPQSPSRSSGQSRSTPRIKRRS